jgi:Tol biopolymer transport system component
MLLAGNTRLRRNTLKSVKAAAGVVLFILLAASAIAQDDNSLKLTGPYLGQEPPGTTPVIFAPGVISVDTNFEHSAAVFSPDGKEVFWCTNVGWYGGKKQPGGLRLYHMSMVDGKWTTPQPAPFTKDIRVERPVFSPDGGRLYFEACVDPNNPDNYDILVVERIGEEWSEPRTVSPLIDSPALERLHCVTSDGSLYFARNPLLRNEEIFVSRFVNGAFTEPEELGTAFNSDAGELAILVSPDEDYMLISQIDDRHSSELNISYKNPDGTWTDRIKTPYYTGGFLALSPDGKYLFMLEEGITWVSTSFIEELKP